MIIPAMDMFARLTFQRHPVADDVPPDTITYGAGTRSVTYSADPNLTAACDFYRNRCRELEAELAALQHQNALLTNSSAACCASGSCEVCKR